MPSTFRTGTGFTSLDNCKCLSRAQLLSTKHPVAPLSSSASTSIVLTGPHTRTRIRTSRPIVMVCLNSTGKPTSRSLAGLSESLDAKEGNFCPLISTQELITPLLMSGVKPLLGTPIVTNRFSNLWAIIHPPLSTEQGVQHVWHVWWCASGSIKVL